MTGAYVIQEQSCPRCAMRRTVRLAAGGYFCFNCRLQWSRSREWRCPVRGPGERPDRGSAATHSRRASPDRDLPNSRPR